MAIIIEEYVPIDWVNNTTPAINAPNLNHSEQGIKRVTDSLIELENQISTEGRFPEGSWTWDGTTLRITVADVI